MPKWRVFTWVILAVNLLFLIWVISGTSSASSNCNGLTGRALSDCQAGTAVGASIGIGLIIVLWGFVDVILGVLWLVTRPKNRRICPSCGTEAKAGVTICKKCGYNFATAAGMPPAPTS